MSIVGRAIRSVAKRQRGARYLARRVRIWWFVRRVKLKAATTPASVHIDVARDARIGRRIRVVFEAGSHSTFRVGAEAWIDDDVRIQLLGGTVRIGPHSEVRRGCVLDVAGALTLDGHNLLSWGSVVHCASSVRLAEHAMCGEYVTFADSAHYFSTPDEPLRENVDAAPITVGRNTWIAAKVTVTKGVSIGSCAVIAANSVVTRNVVDGRLAAGIPAEEIRSFDLGCSSPDDQDSNISAAPPLTDR